MRTVDQVAEVVKQAIGATEPLSLGPLACLYASRLAPPPAGGGEAAPPLLVLHGCVGEESVAEPEAEHLGPPTLVTLSLSLWRCLVLAFSVALPHIHARSI